MKLIQQHHTLRLHELNISLFLPYLTTFRLPGLHSVEWWQYQCIPEHRKAFGTKRRWLSPAFSWSDWEKWQTPLVRFTDHLVPHFKVTGRQLLFMYNCCAFRTHQVIITHVCVCVCVCVCVYIYIYICLITRWRSWMRHCATSQKVAGSIPNGVIVIFRWQSFRSHCGPGRDSASNRNEYQEYFLGGKSGRWVGLTTLPPSCADWLGI